MLDISVDVEVGLAPPLRDLPRPTELVEHPPEVVEVVEEGRARLANQPKCAGRLEGCTDLERRSEGEPEVVALHRSLVTASLGEIEVDTYGSALELVSEVAVGRAELPEGGSELLENVMAEGLGMEHTHPHAATRSPGKAPRITCVSG